MTSKNFDTSQFISSKNNNEVHVMHSKGDKKEIMSNGHSLIDVKIIWRYQ